MGWIFLIGLGLGIGLMIYPQILGPRVTIPPLYLRAGGALIALVALLSTSYTVIDADAVGHLKRIYSFSESNYSAPLCGNE